MNRLLVTLAALAILAVPSSAKANIETDRKAARCAVYLILLGKSGGAQAALSRADNVGRARSLMDAEMAQLGRLKDSGAWNSTTQAGYATGSDSACRAVGIRVSDY